jgi:PhnB protein
MGGSDRIYKTAAVGIVHALRMRTTIRPRLVVADIETAVNYYEVTLAAIETVRFSLPAGLAVHSELEVGDSVITLTEAHEDYLLASPEQIGGSPVLLTVAVDDALAVADAMVAAGGTVIVPIEDRPYGKREGRIRDPFGHLWIVSQDTEALSAVEVDARLASTYRAPAVAEPARPGPHVVRIVPDLEMTDRDGTAAFYEEQLGLKRSMDLGWVMTFVSPRDPAVHVTLLSGDVAAPMNPAATVEVDDATDVHEDMLTNGQRIVYPLTEEPWGVVRFFVADPNGNLLNVMSHTHPRR